ncbi:MAG: PH domain-containing protein [Anaerolineaceae bacterium]
MFDPTDSASYLFPPPRRRGLFLHLGVALLLVAGAGGSLYFAMDEHVGAYFPLLLVVAIIFFLPIPIVVYRGYALIRASYILERDGLHIRWGLRTEDIPLNTVEWIRPVNELGNALAQPPFNATGAILGKREVADLGTVEFLASEMDDALVVVTRDKAFVISPADSRGFLRSFQQVAELGSLNPIPQVSIVPAAFMRHVWMDAYVRILLLVGLGLTVVLFLVVSIAIPNLKEVSIGFTPQGTPMEPGNPVRLLLLPILAALCYGMDVTGGLYFYNKENQHAISYLLLAAGILLPLLLLISVGLLLR